MKHIFDAGNCLTVRNHWITHFGRLEGMGKKLSMSNPASSENLGRLS